MYVWAEARPSRCIFNARWLAVIAALLFLGLDSTARAGWRRLCHYHCHWEQCAGDAECIRSHPDGWRRICHYHCHLAWHPAHGNIIKGTAYGFLHDGETEDPGYGLYSYVILAPQQPDRNMALMKEILKFPSKEEEIRESRHINILYIPVHSETKTNQPDRESGVGDINTFLKTDYSFHEARTLLTRICGTAGASKDNVFKNLCDTELTGGPYIFTYGAPASQLVPLPPPLLFVDLSDVGSNGFAEFIAAYASQVKRPDFSDRQKIDTFRLAILKIILNAATLSRPARAAVADIVHILKK